MRRHPSYLLTGPGLALALSACSSPNVGSVCPQDPNNPAAFTCINAGIDKPISTKPQQDLDILFLIDNSPSMSPKQRALANNIPRFLTAIECIGKDLTNPADPTSCDATKPVLINYHVGVATSDIGSWKAPGVPWNGMLGFCNSYEGDDGQLQAKPCTQRTSLILDAKQACTDLCPDDRYVPTDGTNYISKINGNTNIFVPPGTMAADAPKNAFKCMALVGDQGCGIEGQLEGARRALDGHNAGSVVDAAHANGFLRPNSVLAVIFITDEDDCSVQISRRAENIPDTSNCPAGTPVKFDCFNPDFRCLATDVKCNEPSNQPGLKSNCAETATTYLEDVSSRYVNFFNSLRTADRLVVAGIWTTPSIDKGGKYYVIQLPGTTTSDGLNRDTGTNASCVYPGDPNVVGRPQIRLSKFASQLQGSEVSVCDVDHYDSALASIAVKISTKLKAQCLDGVPKTDKATGAPLCLVGDVDAKTPQASPDVVFPVCSTACCNAFAAAATPTSDDASVKAACATALPAGKTACYCAVASKVVPVAGATVPCAPGVVAGVWRSGPAPDGKVTTFKCAAQ